MNDLKTCFVPGPYWMAADRNPADGTDRLVYDVGVGDKCLATFDRREDALLYRAAPDMLAALEEAHSFLGKIAFRHRCEESACRASWRKSEERRAAEEIEAEIATIRAAISKAKGVSP